MSEFNCYRVLFGRAARAALLAVSAGALAHRRRRWGLQPQVEEGSRSRRWKAGSAAPVGAEAGHRTTMTIGGTKVTSNAGLVTGQTCGDQEV